MFDPTEAAYRFIASRTMKFVLAAMICAALSKMVPWDNVAWALSWMDLILAVVSLASGMLDLRNALNGHDDL